MNMPLEYELAKAATWLELDDIYWTRWQCIPQLEHQNRQSTPKWNSVSLEIKTLERNARATRKNAFPIVRCNHRD
jgi:hypothetical protein